MMNELCICIPDVLQMRSSFIHELRVMKFVDTALSGIRRWRSTSASATCLFNQQSLFVVCFVGPRHIIMSHRLRNEPTRRHSSRGVLETVALSFHTRSAMTNHATWPVMLIHLLDYTPSSHQSRKRWTCVYYEYVAIRFVTIGMFSPAQAGRDEEKRRRARKNPGELGENMAVVTKGSAKYEIACFLKSPPL